MINIANYYTSDSHFYHRNVLKFEERPYETVNEMNEGLISAWNSVIKSNDIIHHLGDFCFGGYDKWKSILDRLNGKIVLYKGNHDDSKALKKLSRDGYFEEIHQVGGYKKIKGYQLWLTHYPMEIGLRPRKFSIHGHIHSVPSNMINQINVGVDSQLPIVKNKPFGTPIALEELLDYLNLLTPRIEELFLEERESR